MAADSSMMRSLEALDETLSLSTGMTPTMAKRELFGFQHLEQPQAWLWATLEERVTVTRLEGQWQWRVPPGWFGLPFVMPLLRAGWREGAIVFGLWWDVFWCWVWCLRYEGWCW